MPTPIAHGVAAWATARTAEPKELGGARLFGLVAFLAIAPDLDFLPGLLIDRPGAFHRGPTHSLAGAFLASLALAWLLSRTAGAWSHRSRSPGWWFGIVLPTYCAHIVLDLVVPDTRGAAGMRLLWPLSDRLIGTPIPLPEALRGFIDLRLGMESGSFLGALLSGHAVTVFLVEGLLFTPLLLAPKLMSGARRRLAGGLTVGTASREQTET